MYRQRLDRVFGDDVLAKTVYDAHGRPLLRAGVTLGARYVTALRGRGIDTVYVRDGLADDLAPRDLISEHVRATISSHVATTFGAIADAGRARHADSPRDEHLSVDDAAARLGEQPLDLGADGGDLVAQLHTDVNTLIADILASETIAGLDSLRSHNEYTFQHSVDVAALGVLLGRQLALDEDLLHHLALGCLLHDIGKMYIDTAILDKPGRLDPEEFALVQEHPRMGFELCRRMPIASLLPAHVAYQHHEQQAGGGYPRGLVGTNTVGPRTDTETLHPGRMLLIAEIAAVADVFSALSSDRPYRDAMAPDQVLDLLGKMAGSHLNRDVVTSLTKIVPRYPVGTWVQVHGGHFDGWRGVVAEVTHRDLDRPTIRLHLDANGESVDGAPVLNLRAAPDVRATCLARHEEPLVMRPAERPPVPG